MIVAAAVLAGWGVGWLLWSVLAEVFAADVFARENYRGRRVATAAGAVIVVSVAGVEAARIVAGRAGLVTEVIGPGRLATIIVVSGFGFLGFVDDLAGSEDRGFRGHLRAMRRGQLTTGGMKLLGGGVVALIAASLTAPPGLGRLLLDAAVIALAANLANLFDRAPGRCLKVGAVGFAGVALTGAGPGLAGPAVAVGASLALAAPDLRERAMLGDTGANALGAAVGLAAVLAIDTPATAVVLAALLALNVLSEVVSFSRVIQRVPPLRMLDRLGRESGES